MNILHSCSNRSLNIVISRLPLSLKRITLHLPAGAIELFAKTFTSHFVVTQNRCVFITHTYTHTHTHARVRMHHTGQCLPTLESHHSHTGLWGQRVRADGLGGREWVACGFSTHQMSWSLSSCTRSTPAHPDHSPGESVRVMLDPWSGRSWGSGYHHNSKSLCCARKNEKYLAFKCTPPNLRKSSQIKKPQPN